MALEKADELLVASPPDVAEEISVIITQALECNRDLVHVVKSTDMDFQSEFSTVVEQGAMKRADSGSPQDKPKDGKEESDMKGAFHGMYYETLEALKKSDGTRALFKELNALGESQYDFLQEMLALQETLDEAKEPKEIAEHIETALEKWAGWKSTARGGAMCILQKHIDAYCDDYVKHVNV